MAQEMEMKSIEMLLIGLDVPYESYAAGDVFQVSNPKTGNRAGTIVNAHTHFEWTNATDDKEYKLSAQEVITSLYHWHAGLQTTP